jgi:hypothetical protein
MVLPGIQLLMKLILTDYGNDDYDAETVAVRRMVLARGTNRLVTHDMPVGLLAADSEVYSSADGYARVVMTWIPSARLHASQCTTRRSIPVERWYPRFANGMMSALKHDITIAS